MSGKINKFKKGDLFEKKVYEHFEEEISLGGLGVVPKNAKIFRKKAYWSDARKSKIITDISIELWPPNAKNYFFLIVVECKDYSHSIPVDDLEEFKAKLDQIAGKNVKGIFATTNLLQKSALNYASSCGLGVIRFIPEDNVEWVFHYRAALTYKLAIPSGLSIEEYKYQLFEDIVRDELDPEPYDYEEGSDFDDDNEVDPLEAFCALTMADFIVQSKNYVGFLERRLISSLKDIFQAFIILP